MPIHKDISFSSTEFQSLISNDIVFVTKKFHLYEPLKDYWLTIASCFSNLEINQIFFSKGVNFEIFGVEHFFNAIYQNNIELVQFYVSHNCFLLGEDEDHLGGAIMQAVNHDNLDMLKYLIELGCDIHLHSDYAFNRGIAENSYQCVKYLIENYSMSYNPTIDYNIQKIIEDNNFFIFDYILDLIPKPFNFNFDNKIQFLLQKGQPEIFDVFIKYQLIDNVKILNNFESLLYYFSSQQKLYKHIENNYSDMFYTGINKNIEDGKLINVLTFLLSQKYNEFNLEKSHLKTLSDIPFVAKILKNQPTLISNILLTEISNKNNYELFSYTFKPECMNHHETQSHLNLVIPQIIEKDFFNDFLKLIFSKPFKSHFENLNKIYSYYKLDLLMADKFKSKIQKI